MPDYASEEKSRYEMWWCFGWPYETTVAMSRLVFAGLFDRHPKLKIVTHHLGGGMIPYFDGRIGPGMDVLGSRTIDEDYSKVLSSLKRPHLEYFREFYADTAMFGGKNGLPCGIEFFGADHVVFATDAPLGPIADHHQGDGRSRSRRRHAPQDHGRQRRAAHEHDDCVEHDPESGNRFSGKIMLNGRQETGLIQHC